MASHHERTGDTERKSQPPTGDQRRTTLADLRSRLANERTHLAYVRTAVALIGFGITLNRFSFFLRQSESQSHLGLLGLRDTQTIGAGMAFMGLGLMAWSLYRFWVVNRDIDRGVFTAHFKPLAALTLGLLVFCGLSILWLIFR